MNCRVRESWQTTTLLFFDTVCEVRLLGSPSGFENGQKEVARTFSEIEQYFSPGTAPLSSPLVSNLFQKARQVFLDSDGDFDITVAPLSRIWGFRHNSHRIPSPEEIQAALNHVGMNKISTAKGILILLPQMELDWGGIAKGLGIDLAVQSLKKLGFSNGLINLGGDLFCWGKNPDSQPWKIGIQHPRKSGFLGVLNISDLGVATSGDYQRYFEINGIRYPHIFNPKTGYPARDNQSVTVIGPETTLCDALSTALFVSRHPEGILNKYPDYGAIIVDKEGTVFLLGKRYPMEIF